MSNAAPSKNEGLVYKNHPLRRVGNLIYYGSMADKYIIMMQILETKKEQDMDVASKVSIQLQLTAPDLKSRDRIVKTSEKKMDMLEELVEAANGKPVLVFYSFRHDLERIQDKFPKAVKLTDSKDIEAWNNGEISMLLAHPAGAPPLPAPG